MRAKFLLLGFLAISCAARAELPVLMPQPAQLQGAGTLVPIPKSLGIAVEGPGQLAQSAALQLLAQFQPQLQLRQVEAAQAQLQIRVRQSIQMPGPDDDESYQLEINKDRINLNAPSSTGMLYGLMALSQLIRCDSSATAGVCTVPTVTIRDQPRFRWRGLLLDSARRFIPLADIRRTLDGMAAAKLNVLHWHLTDDQGWRIESKAYPKLHQLASQGQFYTQAEVQQLVAYAAARGIRVVPELDLPGHASAIGMAYPELLAWPDAVQDQQGLKPLPAERRFGVFTPVLDISSAATWQFIQALVAEWRQMFPDPYLHIGGDEVKADHWLANSKIQRLMQQQQLADGHALQAYFNQQLAHLLQQQQRRMIGWDETLHPALPQTTLVQSWQGQDALGAAVRAGHPALLSAGFYLDMPQPAAYHWQNDPLLVTAPLTVPADKKQQLQFGYNLQRLNGKAVTGTVRLYQTKNGQWQGSLAATGRGVVPAQVRVWLVTPGAGALQVRVDADNYLGPVQLRFNLQSGAPAQALALIGNHSYPLELRAEPYQALAATPALTAAQQQLLWGGEAALWTELVSPDLLDTKLWPRLFVVAERFWSPAGSQHIATLPSRLQQMDDYALQIGLLHRQQAQASLQQWATRVLTGGSTALTPAQFQALQDFSQYLQPLHYYGRHHLKTAAGRYHLDEPLNQLADALLLEPPVLLALQQSFAAAPACQLPTDWSVWQRAFTQQQQLLSPIATGSPELKRLLAQQQQFSRIISANSQPAEKASQLLQLLQPAGEVVFAPAAAALDWADRCAAQTQ
ncbi:beta-N-acetylhexosaminidase [Rheinheimera tilapiae]|uniref:beta-N-acetylhexosaminidase n=1 Tax=Rheinheimera tilapiae TaxID=875043 RepID=A0ABV6BH04_9GAMM